MVVRIKTIPTPPRRSLISVLTLISAGVVPKLGMNAGSAGYPMTYILIKSLRVSSLSNVTVRVPVPRVRTGISVVACPGSYTLLVEEPGVKTIVPSVYTAGFIAKVLPACTLPRLRTIIKAHNNGMAKKLLFLKLLCRFMFFPFPVNCF
jgi:hypothetical protein